MSVDDIHSSRKQKVDRQETKVALPVPIYGRQSYATRKTLAEGMLDIALLMANASQLKAILDIPVDNRDNYFIPSLLLLGISIALQIAASIILLCLGIMEVRLSSSRRRAEILNNVCVGLILAIIILNVFVASFGISYSG